jgi:hypothetical protein
VVGASPARDGHLFSAEPSHLRNSRQNQTSDYGDWK